MESTSERIHQIQELFINQLISISGYPDEKHRLIIMLSLIDSIAQESAGYSHDSKKTFYSFVQSYCNKYRDILKEICPITLYYDYFSDSNNVDLKLMHRRIYFADSWETKTESKRLIELLPDDKKNTAKERHSYTGLLYQLRNKLVHESLLLNMPIDFQEENEEPIPHIACYNKLEDGKLLFDHWTLIIPEAFVKNVATEVIDNYLKYCLSRDYIPFNRNDRKCFYGWYD